MQVAIQIAKLNDFIFCPYSIYLHSIYESFDDKVYNQTPQTIGTINHENIDKNKYSSLKRYLQGIPIYSDKYKLIGKIDIYDSKTQALIDRKYKIKQVYDGYKYQLYAQFFGMKEKGYKVKKLFLHSLSDNKRYEVDLPEDNELRKFESLIKQIWQFYDKDMIPDVSAKKCANCIYNSLCAYAKSS